MYNNKQLNSKTTISLYVNVLTMTNWPTYPVANVLLPPEMSNLQEKFTDFYKRKYSGRNLQWQPSLGHCLVKGYISPGVFNTFLFYFSI